MKCRKSLLFTIVLLLISGLADATDWWPMYRHDLNHTGYSTSRVNMSNLVLKWNYTTGDQVYSSPAVVDGVVFIGSRDDNMYALNATTGEHIWNYSTGGDIFSSPAVSDGVVFVSSWDGKIYALNASTGTHLWNYTTGISVGSEHSSPAVVDGVVFIGSADNNTYALNASTGERIWNYTTGLYVYSSPAVVNGVVFIGSLFREVYALNATTGEHIWDYTTEGNIDSSPAVADGVVFIGSHTDNSHGGWMYALNASTGEHLWDYSTGANIRSSPAVAYGMVFLGSEDNKMYALNASTGTHLWNYTTGDFVKSSPAVANGIVFIGSSDFNVYALNATTGEHLWNYTTGVFAAYVESSPAIADGMVFVGSFDFNVYAFGPDISPPGVTLNSPGDGATDTDGNVIFTYTPSDDTGIFNCSLYGNFTGTWHLNKTDDTISNGVQNLFSLLGLSSGMYLWNVECADKVGHFSFAESNWTVQVSVTTTTTTTIPTTTTSTSTTSTTTSTSTTTTTLPGNVTSFNMSLEQGWNLKSIPLNLDTWSITSVLSSINGEYDIVWVFMANDTEDHWKKYVPGSFSFGSDLSELSLQNGFWINMKDSSTLSLSGMEFNESIVFYGGANLIGYPRTTSQAIEDFLSPIAGNYTLMWMYNATETAWKVYNPYVIDPAFNSLNYTTPGFGYWIQVNGSDRSTYNNLTIAVSIPESYVGLAYIYDPSWSLAPNGTNVTVVSSNGWNKTTTVVTTFGGWTLDVTFDDSNTPEKEGAQSFDNLTWYIAGQQVTSCNLMTPCNDTAVIGGISEFNITYESSVTTTTTTIPNVVINEFLPHPSSGELEWIELYNRGNGTVNVSSWQLDDVASGGSAPYTIPNNVILSENFLLFYANETGISLSDVGDTVRLLDNEGNIVDNFTYYISIHGISFGRETDGGVEWTTFEVPTPNASNLGVNDTSPPDVTLNSPVNGHTSLDGFVILGYTPRDSSTIDYCLLYTNITGSWGLNQIDMSIFVNSRNSFALIGLSNGTYAWNVDCMDAEGYSAIADYNKWFTVGAISNETYNTQINGTYNQTITVTSNASKVTLEINITENISNVNVIISSYYNNTKNASLSVPGLGKYISIQSSSELEESLSLISLKMYYTESELTENNLTEDDLGIWWFNETESEWQLLNSNTMDWVRATGVNRGEDYVWANVEHLSDYTIAQAQTQSIPLLIGWNLISIPLVI